MDQESGEAPVLAAFRLSEERAAAGYLAARKDMLTLSWRVASLRRLVREQPARADYRAALAAAQEVLEEAQQRTDRAEARWHRAQVRTDAQWSTTYGKAVA